MTQSSMPPQGGLPAARRAGPLVITGEPPLLDGALRVAEAICRRDRASAYIVAMVRPLPASFALPPELAAELEPGELDECRRIQAQARLSARVREAVGLSSFFTIGAELAAPERALADTVRVRGAACLLTGVASPGGESRDAGIAAAAALADGTDVPVVAVPTSTALLPQTALVCVDLTEPSLRAAAAALPFLADDGALTLVHVVPTMTGASDAGAAWIDAGVRTAEQRLPRLAAELSRAGVRTETLLLHGEPAEVLADRVPGFDLVVLGTPRRSRERRTTPGGVWDTATSLARGSLLFAPRDPQAR